MQKYWNNKENTSEKYWSLNRWGNKINGIYIENIASRRELKQMRDNRAWIDVGSKWKSMQNSE